MSPSATTIILITLIVVALLLAVVFIWWFVSRKTADAAGAAHSSQKPNVNTSPPLSTRPPPQTYCPIGQKHLILRPSDGCFPENVCEIDLDCKGNQACFNGSCTRVTSTK